MLRNVIIVITILFFTGCSLLQPNSLESREKEQNTIKTMTGSGVLYPREELNSYFAELKNKSIEELTTVD